MSQLHGGGQVGYQSPVPAGGRLARMQCWREGSLSGAADSQGKLSASLLQSEGLCYLILVTFGTPANQ